MRARKDIKHHDSQLRFVNLNSILTLNTGPLTLSRDAIRLGQNPIPNISNKLRRSLRQLRMQPMISPVISNKSYILPALLHLPSECLASRVTSNTILIAMTKPERQRTLNPIPRRCLRLKHRLQPQSTIQHTSQSLKRAGIMTQLISNDILNNRLNPSQQFRVKRGIPLL